MPAALKEALERIGTLAEGMDPNRQAYALETLEKLAAELEEDRVWDELVASPESQAFLDELSAGLDEAIANGTTVEGGWSL